MKSINLLFIYYYFFLDFKKSQLIGQIDQTANLLGLALLIRDKICHSETKFEYFTLRLL